MRLKVFLVNPDQIIPSPGDHLKACYDEILSCFQNQPVSKHVLAVSAEDSDFILAPVQGFAYGIGLERLKRSKLYKNYRHKFFVYSPDDNQLPTIRGLYPSISKSYVAENWSLPAHYLSSHIYKFKFDPDRYQSRDYLYSFVGSSDTHHVREAILGLPSGNSFLLDSSKDLALNTFWWMSDQKDKFRELFRDVTARSLFVICPRGLSPSSIRIFEAMEAGCVPIIVSDEIQLPLGPEWSQFSIRVDEKDVQRIPSIAQQMRDAAPTMGALARRTWEDYFSPSGTPDFIVGSCKKLLSAAPLKPMRLSLEEISNPALLKSRIKTKLDDLRW